MSKHFLNSFFCFVFLHLNECEMQMSYANAMMRMSLWCMQWCECNLVGMQWCRCPFKYAMNANAPLWVYNDTNVLMQTQFIQKFLLFSKRGFHNAWNQNIFTLDLLFMKSHLPFDLRFPKKLVITVRKSPNGAFTWNLMIWIKRLIFAIWLSKEMVHFQGSFLEKWII